MTAALQSGKLAVEVRNLSKRYKRGAIGARTLREELALIFSRDASSMVPASDRDFYALSDVSLSIPEGAACGIIGRNGSGKTTLLKILSSITAPSSGEAVMHGRVGSLLEVGAGFHPELDGVENIYLNGAILGMSKAEIRRKLDEIIKFADIGPVLDTPVKRYSSGMYVRLAFAIAAHLEPDILIVDEVLAVGDADFQRKCMGKMKSNAEEGRTVLFVSHNIAAVRQLCDMAIHLESGRLKHIGPVDSVVDAYLAEFRPQGMEVRRRITAGGRSAEVTIHDARTGAETVQLKFGGDYDFVLHLDASVPLHRVTACVRIFDESGSLLATLDSLAEGIEEFRIFGPAQITFKLRPLALIPGSYVAGISLYTWGEDDAVLASDSALAFDVLPATINGSYWPYDRHHGIFRLSHGAKYSASGEPGASR